MVGCCFPAAAYCSVTEIGGGAYQWLLAVRRATSVLNPMSHPQVIKLLPVTTEICFYHPDKPASEVLDQAIRLGRDTGLLSENQSGGGGSGGSTTGGITGTCRRCGRTGHYVRTCRAMKDVNGNTLPPARPQQYGGGYQQGYRMMPGGANAQPLGHMAALPAPQ